MEDSLYRAEYAKSGRASCKECGEKIASDTLRLAIMVQSPMFDGKVPHWHHFACFWKRIGTLSPNEMDGFSELRWEDQEKIKKAIESGGASAEPGGGRKGKGKAEKSLGGFAVEYAKSNRSTCKGCNQKIEKNQVRISKKMVDPEKPQLGLIDRWYHVDCFVSNRVELSFLPTFSASQFQGFSALTVEDKRDLKKKLPAVKTEGKRKADEVDGQPLLKKKKEKEKEAEQEKLLKEQSEMIWKIKDSLRKNCSTDELKELLMANEQEVPSGESAILDRVADGMAFGGLIPCSKCLGQFVLKSDAYYCTGDISAWTKCVAKTQTPKRMDWLIPKAFHEIPYLKRYKFKKQDRMFSTVTTTSVSVPAPAAPAPVLEEPKPADKPLTNMKILTLGRLSKGKDEIKAWIEKLGGKTTGAANKATLCISTQKEVEKMNKKMEEMKAANVRVVSESFLSEVESGKSFQELLTSHALSSWGAEVKQESIDVAAGQKTSAPSVGKSAGKVKEEQGTSKSEKKMKLTVKGGAAVDPDSGLQDSAHVLENNGKIFSATLGLVDIVRGTNSYYKLQLLEGDKENRYWIFRSWGRVGTEIGSHKLEKMPSKEEAIDQFLSLYEEKTGNYWHDTKFKKYPNKFYPLEIDYGQDEDTLKKLSLNSGAKSKLPKPIQELITLIFDIESMKKAMVEFEIDLQKMPLGKLSKRQIQSAYSILSKVQQAVSNSATEPQILDLSNRFYTLIPHNFGMKKPPLLNNLEYIQAKVQMLDNLLDIEVAYSLLKSGAEDGGKNPIDINYEKLRTDIQVIDKDSEEAKILKQYVKNTHAVTHNTYDLEIVDIFKIEREGEQQRYKPFQELHNRKLLWHGSRTTNFAGILSQGLRIAPPEAPVTGYMFGKGIYFADMVSKSANYCHAFPGNSTGLILVGEVALGNMHELKAAAHISKLPKGKHSVKGLGMTAPDPTASVTLNGVEVPLGKGVETGISNASLLYNEYIVYDVAQVNLKYLLKLNFKYKSPLW